MRPQQVWSSGAWMASPSVAPAAWSSNTANAVMPASIWLPAMGSDDGLDGLGFDTIDMGGSAVALDAPMLSSTGQLLSAADWTMDLDV
jgi:hypothetical protein